MNAGTEGENKSCLRLLIVEKLFVANFFRGVFFGEVLKKREALRWEGVAWITVREGDGGIVRDEAKFEQWLSLLIFLTQCRYEIVCETVRYGEQCRLIYRWRKIGY